MGTESSGGGDADDHAALSQRLDGMDHHAARPGTPLVAGGVFGEAFREFPVLAIVGAAEQRARIRAQIHDAGFIGSPGRDVPNAGERSLFAGRQFRPGQLCTS